MFLFEAKRIIIVLIGALLNAIALNFFLISANVYASGFTGMAQILSSVFSDLLHIQGLSTGIILLILNIPVAILGWIKVGRGFTIYSFISVLFTTICLEVLPIVQISPDIMLNAVFGGVIAGVGIGITLKWGASTGGSDIVAMVLSRVKDKPIGTYMMVINGVIILLAGIIYEPENALYTLLALYVTTRVIDVLHTRHEKVTAMIVTTKADDLQKEIHNTMVRGITILPARGAYSKVDKNMLFLVITRYELYDLERIIQEVDPNAFTNIVETAGIFGFFRKND
ncbi:YitT family protein [Aquibacillus koreensis]|uniref:YitT family protein n=1 Tax=Aquibacillus koreensis TaxID=279446 RepID=A0A9X3WKR2_9BACI|nr:YitT family protein [Aquibacillus koreensis]MCT2535619.1 YitT family protein [Aquibacillus koreensis]MDC3420096.1 YitT family protein [Aquibacillus koreensis]